MQIAKQLSVSMVNKPGRLAATLTALSKAKIRFRAFSVMDSGDRGTVRFIPDREEAAIEVLEKQNVRFEAADVLIVEVPNQTSALQKICERLAAEHLNIDYAYSSCESGDRGAMIAVIKVNSLAKAEKLLRNGDNSRWKQPGRRPVHAR